MSQSKVVSIEYIYGYRPLEWKGQPVYSRYKLLYNFVKNKLGVQYASMFAQPHITDQALSGGAKVKWLSDSFTNNAKPVSLLEEPEKSLSLETFRSRYKVFTEFSEKLKNSNNEDDRYWGELIQLAVTIPDEEHILAENDKILLTCWGFETKSGSIMSGSISENNESNKIDTDTTQNELPEHSNRENLQTSPKESETAPIKEDNGNTDSLDTPSDTINNSLNSSKEEEQHIENKRVASNNNGGKNGWFDNFNKWGCLKSIVLMLLVIAVIWLLFRTCDSGNNYLPPQPGIIPPVDSSKIIDDPDTVRKIVGDVINVALKGENNDVEKFAKKFKKIFPAEDYTIIYYDTVVYRLQIKVPVEERESIKKTLKSNFNEFDLLIWDESLFNSSLRPNDPSVQDPKQSWYLETIKAYSAWNVTQGDSGVVIAVIDNYFDLDHIEIKDKVYKPWNAVKKQPVVDVPSAMNDGYYHGSHVAGTATAFSDNAIGIAGIAPKCKLMPIQVGDDQGFMTSTAIIDAVLYAIHNGADVVNMSLGMKASPQLATFPPPVQKQIIDETYQDEEEFWDEVFSMAYDNDVVFVLAAGNDNVMIGIDPMQRYENTIVVSATDPNNEKAEFSNFGERSTISAPGVDIYSLYPGNDYKYCNGTSMAAPIVTGGVALMKSINPVMPFEEIVKTIQNTGIPVTEKAGRYVGNIIQLHTIVGAAEEQRKKHPKVECPNVQTKIDSLLSIIERLKDSCEVKQDDTLKIPPNASDCDFAIGKWMSTTRIHKIDDKRIPVTIYFDIQSQCKGQIILKEETLQNFCYAPLELSVNAGKLYIEQTKDAYCDLNNNYVQYTFECVADKNGNAECIAQNKSDKTNTFAFKLIKE